MMQTKTKLKLKSKSKRKSRCTSMVWAWCCQSDSLLWLSIYLSVHDWRLWTQYLTNHLRECHQTYAFHALWHKDVLVRLWGQKVRVQVQGRNETNVVGNFLSGSLCHRGRSHGGSVNWIGCVAFGEMRSKVKVTARPDGVKKAEPYASMYCWWILSSWFYNIHVVLL